VYYQVDAQQKAEAYAAISEMQAKLRRSHPGLKTGMLCRTDATEAGQAQTWMETYEHADGVSAACLDQIERLVAALPSGLTGKRHVEVFSPLRPDTA
jgi:hypothetical protein